MSFVQRQYDDETPVGFEPTEDGYCELCGQERELDSGLCETCYDLRELGLEDVDIASGAYWFAVHYYNGMGDPLYAAQCRSPYHPGRCETGPDRSAQESYDAHIVASGLEPAEEINPEEGASRRF